MRWIRYSALFLACGALALTACTEDVTSPTQTDEAALEAPAFAKSVSDGLPPADDLGAKHIVVFSRRSGAPRDFESAVADLGGTVDAVYKRVGAAVVSGLTAGAAVVLQNRSDVTSVEVEPVIVLDLPDYQQGELLDAVPASPTQPWTALLFSEQWNLRAIGAHYAWLSGRFGSSHVTLAILDTGIDYLYPDLVGRVDLSRSASFIPQDDADVDASFPGRDYVTDLHWHGTHVSTIAVSNAAFFAGVTSGVTLMGVKVCSWQGGCPGSAIFQGIMHAVENGADVINMSLGGYAQKREYPGFVSAINRLLNYARSRGVTMVVSAGNEGVDLDHIGDWYATYCDAPNVICVSATGPTARLSAAEWENVDAPAFYTNYGRSAIDVAAPGGNSAASANWVPGPCSTSSLEFPPCQAAYYVLSAAGTSQAAPHVAGLAALMVEDFGRNPGRIKAAIQQSADDLGQPGTDPWYGKGRINVATAVGAN